MRLPLVPVCCRHCTCSTDAAILFKVPDTLRYTLVPSSGVTATDTIHVAGKCRRCQQGWCVTLAA